MAPIASNYYEVLGVARSATASDIHRAYRRLALRYHPDVNAGADARVRFEELSDAYQLLSDPAERARYDRSIASPDPKRHARGPVPVLRAERPRRDVPRFLDEDGPRLRPQVSFRVRIMFGWWPR